MAETHMTALLFEGPAPDATRTRSARVEIPQLGSGDVLVEVWYAGVNFKDVMVRRGDPGYVERWPVVPGLEVSGVIAAVGEAVDDFDVGDRVAALTNQGGFAEHVVADARLTTLVPDAVPMQVAAAAPAALATAELLVHTMARVAPGDVVAVHSAAGAVGEAIAQLATAVGGVTLVAFVGSAARAGQAERLGYEHVFVRGTNLVEEVRARLADRQITTVLDSQGTQWLDHDLELLAPGGRVVLFGNAGGDSFAPMPPATTLMRKNLAVGGFSLAGFSASSPGRMRDAITRTLERLSDGSVRPSVTLEDGLDSVPRIQDLLAAGKGDGRKYVVRVSGE